MVQTRTTVRNQATLVNIDTIALTLRCQKASTGSWTDQSNEGLTDRTGSVCPVLVAEDVDFAMAQETGLLNFVDHF